MDIARRYEIVFLKMHMIPMRTDFQENNFIPSCNIHAHCRQYLIDFLAHHNPSIFGWTHNMIEQNTYVMSFRISWLIPLSYRASLSQAIPQTRQAARYLTRHGINFARQNLSKYNECWEVNRITNKPHL